MAGRIGREILGAAQILFLVFAMGSHILTFSIMMNTITSHATCTLAFSIAGTLICLLFTLPRTMKKVSYMAIGSFISILSAVMITIIGVGIENPSEGKVDVVVRGDLYKGFGAVTNIIFAYAGGSSSTPLNALSAAHIYYPVLNATVDPFPGHVAFFSFISELRSPESYPKALFLLQSVDISMYLTVALVIYCYAGPDVASPALGSTSPLLRKIAYGVATPTIM